MGNFLSFLLLVAVIYLFATDEGKQVRQIWISNLEANSVEACIE